MTLAANLASVNFAGQVAPVFDLLIGGVRVDPNKVRLIRLERTENQHDAIAINVVDIIPHGVVYAAGTPLFLRWGVQPNIMREFYGYLVSVEPVHDVGQGQSPGSVTATIRGLGATSSLNNVEPEAWVNATIPAVITEVAERQRFVVVADSHTHVWPVLIRSTETDWEWIVKLAGMIGFRVTNEGHQLRLYDPARVTNGLSENVPVVSIPGDSTVGAGATFMLTAGVGTDASREWFGFARDGTRYTTAATWSPPVLGTEAADRPLVGFVQQPNTDPATTAVYVEAAKRRNWWTLRADARTVGHPDIRPGNLVSVEGTAAEYSGLWCVIDARHEIGIGSLTVSCALGRDAVQGVGMTKVRYLPVAPKVRLLSNGKWGAVR